MTTSIHAISTKKNQVNILKYTYTLFTIITDEQLQQLLVLSV